MLIVEDKYIDKYVTLYISTQSVTDITIIIMTLATCLKMIDYRRKFQKHWKSYWDLALKVQTPPELRAESHMLWDLKKTVKVMLRLSNYWSVLWGRWIEFRLDRVNVVNEVRGNVF